MTLLCVNLAVLLLFLSASPLLHSNPFTHAASTSPPITRKKITFLTADIGGDYTDELSPSPEVPEATTLRRPTQFCQFNPCLEDQEPCTKLAERTRCLCPGVSGSDKPPHAPRIQGLVQVSEGDERGKVEVQWCAPSSMVSGYRVVIEGSDGGALEFGEGSRRGVVRSLEAGTKVCVEAVNSAGHSIQSDFSCKRYEPPETSDHKLLAGVIGGGVALLLLLILAAVILWQYQMRKKAKRDSTDGLGNPSYSRDGTM